MNYAELKKELTRDEDRRAFVYEDSKGIQTVGIGHNLKKKMPDRVIDLLYEFDVEEAIADLDRALPWWSSLDEVRQRILANMSFNMGIARLLKFRMMLDRLKAGDFNGAAAEMVASQWFGETGKRAERLVSAMRTGVMP